MKVLMFNKLALFFKYCFGKITADECDSSLLALFNKFKISSDDTTPGFADDKIIVDGSLQKITVNPGENEQLLIRGLNGLGWKTISVLCTNDYDEAISNNAISPDEAISLQELNTVNDDGELKNIIIQLHPKVAGTCCGDLTYIGCKLSEIKTGRDDLKNRMILIRVEDGSWLNIKDGGLTPTTHTLPVVNYNDGLLTYGYSKVLSVNNDEEEGGFTVFPLEKAPNTVKHIDIEIPNTAPINVLTLQTSEWLDKNKWNGDFEVAYHFSDWLPRNVAVVMKFDKTGTADYKALIGRKLILKAKGDCWFGLDDQVIDGGFLTGMKEGGGTDTPLPLERVVLAEYIGYDDGTYSRWLLTGYETQRKWFQRQNVICTSLNGQNNYQFLLPDTSVNLPLDGYYMFHCNLDVTCNFPKAGGPQGWHFADILITLLDSDGVKTVERTPKGDVVLQGSTGQIAGTYNVYHLKFFRLVHVVQATGARNISVDVLFPSTAINYPSITAGEYEFHYLGPKLGFWDNALS